MSDIVEKTLASFPKFLSEGLLGVGVNQTRPNKHDVPTGLRQLISTVHSARSKSDEELIIKKETSFLLQRFSQTNQSSQQVRETYSRLLFCLTLGYDVSFATIHTVKLAQQGTGLLKRLGYLLSCLLLHENHEMLILLINTIQKDLKSSNLLDNCMGLSAASQLLNAENIPMFLPLVLEKLKHQRELVRLRAAHCLHQFYLKAPSMLVLAHANFQKALCDKDPGVIQGIVQIYIELTKSSPSDYSHLGSSFLGILNQIINRSFPAVHEYHSVPLPWLQISLLKVLAHLGADNEELKTEMYPVLRAVIQRATVKHNIAFAVLYECILTVAKIGGDRDLLVEASDCVAKFLGSSSHTLKYLGIKALTSLVTVNAEYAVQHQIAVVECLDGEELATQRKTLELLYRMANQTNVKAICSKLFEHLKRTDDGYFKTDLATKIVELAENLSPDVRWYVETVNAVLIESKENTDLADRLMDRLDNELQFTEDEEFEQFLATSYLPFLENANSPESLLQLALWVLGELKVGLKYFKPVRIVAAVCSPLCGASVEDGVQSLALSSLVKLILRGVLEARIVREWTEHQKYNFKLPQLQQKYQEVVRLVSLSNHSAEISQFQNGHKKTQYDFTLSFLDDYVCTSLETSGSPYRPLGVRLTASHPDTEKEESYSALYQEIISPSKYDSPRSSQRADSFTTSNTSEGSDRTGEEAQNRDSGLKMSGVRRVWGREGYLGGETDKPQPDVSHTTQRVVQGKDASKKEQLAKALFEGIAPVSNQQGAQHPESVQRKRTSSGKSDSEDSRSSRQVQAESYLPLDESNLPSSDSSGWRAYSAKHTANTSDHLVAKLKSGQEITSFGFVTQEQQGSDLLNAGDAVKSKTLVPKTSSVVTSANNVMPPNPATPSSESMVSAIAASLQESVQKQQLSQSSESERREIWLANEGSPQHVQYNDLNNSEGVDVNQGVHSSIYDYFTDDEVRQDAVFVQKQKSGSPGDSDETSEASSLYSEYYTSQS